MLTWFAVCDGDTVVELFDASKVYLVDGDGRPAGDVVTDLDDVEKISAKRAAWLSYQRASATRKLDRHAVFAIWQLEAPNNVEVGEGMTLEWFETAGAGSRHVTRVFPTMEGKGEE